MPLEPTMGKKTIQPIHQPISKQDGHNQTENKPYIPITHRDLLHGTSCRNAVKRQSTLLLPVFYETSHEDGVKNRPDCMKMA